MDMTETTPTHPGPLKFSSRVIHSLRAQLDFVRFQWRVLGILSLLFAWRKPMFWEYLLEVIDANLFTDKSSAKFGHVRPQVVYFSFNYHNKNTA